MSMFYLGCFFKMQRLNNYDIFNRNMFVSRLIKYINNICIVI